MKSFRDEPNTQREYETIFILKPTVAADGISAVNGRVRAALESHGGKALKVENWGRRRLAYEIKKERKGVYIYWQYLASQGLVEEIERNLRMLEDVLRYFTVKIGENVNPATVESTVTEEAYLKASSTVPDEEQMMMSSSAASLPEDEFDPEVEEMALRRN